MADDAQLNSIEEGRQLVAARYNLANGLLLRGLRSGTLAYDMIREQVYQASRDANLIQSTSSPRDLDDLNWMISQWRRRHSLRLRALLIMSQVTRLFVKWVVARILISSRSLTVLNFLIHRNQLPVVMIGCVSSSSTDRWSLALERKCHLAQI